MTTLAQLRTAIRAELNDAGGTSLWSDALLLAFIQDAIRDYSRLLPLKTTTTITAVADQEEYTLPDDLQELDRVTQPDDMLRYKVDPLRTSQGDPQASAQLVDYESRVGVAAARPGYWVYGPTLRLDPAPASTGSDQNITLWYRAVYELPAAAGDILATPTADDDLLRSLACAKALDWITTDEAKRQRFERQTGASAAAAANRYLQRFDREIQRRRSRLRTSTLEPI